MRDLKIYISVASIIFVGYLVALYNQPKAVDWRPTFLRSDKIPYGTFVLHQQLPVLFPGSNIVAAHGPLYNTLKELEHPATGNYVVVAGSINTDKNDFKELVSYMKQGNSVFIAAFNFSRFLSDTLKLRTGVEKLSPSGEGPSLHFTNQALSAKEYRFDKGIGAQYFRRFDTTRAIVLGMTRGGHANFIKYPFGKGALYLVASPQLFTNYVVLKPAGESYAATALSYLPPGKEVIWDEYFTLDPNDKEGSPLGVVLRHPPLRNAWYLALFSLVVFVLFEMKRRQRVIPIADPMRNTTAEFVQVVGQVYYQQRNNQNIAQKKVSYLLEHIRSRYQLKTNELDDEFRELLIHRAGAEAGQVDELLALIRMVQSGTKISDQQLTGLYRHIQRFNQL